HVRLVRARADERRVALRAEQESDRLREDRLARSGLARDRAEPGGGLELGLADQDEVLDAEPAKHPGDGKRSSRSAPSARTADAGALARDLTSGSRVRVHGTPPPSPWHRA